MLSVFLLFISIKKRKNTKECTVKYRVKLNSLQGLVISVLKTKFHENENLQGVPKKENVANLT